MTQGIPSKLKIKLLNLAKKQKETVEKFEGICQELGEVAEVRGCSSTEFLQKPEVTEVLTDLMAGVGDREQLVERLNNLVAEVGVDYVEVLLEYEQTHGLNHKALAEQIGVPRPTLTNWLSRKRSISIEGFKKIKSFLDQKGGDNEQADRT